MDELLWCVVQPSLVSTLQHAINSRAVEGHVSYLPLPVVVIN
jgi:hypothetical protein